MSGREVSSDETAFASFGQRHYGSTQRGGAYGNTVIGFSEDRGIIGEDSRGGTAHHQVRFFT